MDKQTKIGKFGYRTDYQLEYRLSKIPKEVYDAIYHTLTDEDGAYALGRKRWRMILTDEARAMHDYEVKVMCEKIGCTVHELLDPDVDLLPICLKKKVEQVVIHAERNYGLTG